MHPDFVKLWIFNKKNWEFFWEKIANLQGFQSENSNIFFLLLGPTFFLINVPVRRLYQSDVCTGPTFVLSDVRKSYVCTVRRLWVRRLYWYRNSHNLLSFLFSILTLLLSSTDDTCYWLLILISSIGLDYSHLLLTSTVDLDYWSPLFTSPIDLYYNPLLLTSSIDI